MFIRNDISLYDIMISIIAGILTFKLMNHLFNKLN